MDFELKNKTHRASLYDHDVRVKKNFLNWGHICHSDTRSQNYGKNTKTISK